MPFGSRPTRDAALLVEQKIHKWKVTNAFRQSSHSGPEKPFGSLTSNQTMSPMPFGSRPTRDRRL